MNVDSLKLSLIMTPAGQETDFFFVLSGFLLISYSCHVYYPEVLLNIYWGVIFVCV